MSQDKFSLPTRKSAGKEEIETRPLYVEEWLETLPYVDFKKTSRLLVEATRATNAQTVKAGTRFELVQLYNRPYQYYVDSQIRTGAQHTLQSIETMQEQIDILKRIAVNLALSCKLAAEESLKQKTLWRQSKPPLDAMLGSLHFLAHALIFSFLEYSPMPKNVWREMHFAYEFAESLGQEHTLLIPPGGDAKADGISIVGAYKRIVMATLADPHHLPFGAVWEIYEQLGRWVQHVETGKLDDPRHRGGYFVVKLDSDARPVPLAKFDLAKAGPKYRLVDASALGGLIEDQLELLKAGRKLDPDVRLSPYFAKSVLAHLQRSWGLPPKRHHPREPGTGTLQLTCGLNGAFYFLNGEQEFQAPAAGSGETDDGIVGGPMEVTPPANYLVEDWNLVDQGPGGFAVIKKDKPQYTVRVGDLVAIGSATGAGKPLAGWRLGVIRWLMVQQGQSYRIGVQTLPGELTPVAVRAVAGSSHDSRFRRALHLHDAGSDAKQSLIAERGLYLEDRPLEITRSGTSANVRAGNLMESAVGFEHFTVHAG